MKTIFEEYGGAIITVIAIILFIAIIVLLLSNTGIVSENFKTLLQSFFNKANGSGASHIGSGINKT